MVIPAYRAAATIRRAIDSVLAQTRPAAEIIVVDDGSPDDQAAIVERAYGGHVILLRQPNGGAARARNAGIDRSTGDFIAFLDADDYWEPEKLAVQLALFERHPDLGLVAGAFFEEDPGDAGNRRTIRAGPASWYGKSMAPRGRSAFRLATLVWTGTVLVRKRVLGEERFVPGLEPAEDRDLWARVVSRHPGHLTPAPLATAVLVPGSLSRTNLERDCSNMLRVVERHRELLGFAGKRVWRSYTLYRWAALDPTPRSALPRLLHSFALWPIPYTGFLNCRPFGRVKRLAMLLIAWTQRPLPSSLDSRT